MAFPNVHLSEYDLFRQELKVVHAGVTIGELKGKGRYTGSFVGNEHIAES